MIQLPDNPGTTPEQLQYLPVPGTKDRRKDPVVPARVVPRSSMVPLSYLQAQRWLSYLRENLEVTWQQPCQGTYTPEERGGPERFRTPRPG